MEWYQVVSFFFSNGIRFFLCICLIVKLMDFSKVKQKSVIYTLIGTGIITIISLIPLSQFYLKGIEILILFWITHLLFGENPRIRFVLIFFYEIGVSLWEFLISAGLSVLFQSQKFITYSAPEYMVGVWIVRLLMLCIVVFFSKRKHLESRDVFRFASMIAILGLFGVIMLSGQSVIWLNDDQLTTWIILALLLMFAILFFNLNRQYEMEKKILCLKEEQNELLERDYQTLNQAYTANAKLYHDLHNHLEVMYRYLTQGKTGNAIQYLEDLRTPIKDISQTVWTGDDAIDYLINSKIALAKEAQIVTKVNIEFPCNTNIRGADLTAILGNLLDNAIEGGQNSAAELRFINMTIRRINNMIVIKIENSCEVPPNEEMQSIKQDKRLHGWGLKSVRTAAEHYDGILETTFKDSVFCAVVTLSYDILPIK